MRTCLFLIAIATLCAQAPPPPTAETVVAKIAGKDVTLGDIQKMIETYRPEFAQALQKDAPAALRDAFVIRYLAAEGEKLKLAEQSPLKEQIEAARLDMIGRAMVTHERNFYQVSPEDVDKFYQANQARYQETQIKVIKLAFKPAAPGPQSIEDIARHAVESAHAPSDRSEAEARKLAADLVKQLRGGADFAKLAAQYSDDEESKASGGDYGTVKPASMYTDDFKKAVFALKVGEVSDPIAVGPALYIVRAEKKNVQPLSAVREQIMDEIKNSHLGQYLTGLQKQFTPVIERPDILIQLNATMAQRPAAK